MPGSARQGTFLLTLAQAWHALSSYVIFVTAARLLGPERFGDFGLVAWTMTTLETCVVAGVPKAVSYHVARAPHAAGAITRLGLRITFGLAATLTLLLVAASPLVVAVWRDPTALGALRVSALDFVAFAGFAVLVQTLNGLQHFGRQAVTWLIYSTVKVGAVLALLAVGNEVSWGIAGYVLASAVASAVAVGTTLRHWRSRRDANPAPRAAEMWRFGMPLAVHAMVLMALLNADLWAAKWAALSRESAGAYVAASTLARALYFVFVAFGEAIFPVVARELNGGRQAAAVAAVREAMSSLLCLLIPLTAMAMATAQPVLTVVYGNSVGAAAGYEQGAPILALLAPAAAALTVVAVLANVLAAAGHGAGVARGLLGLLLMNVVVVFLGAQQWGVLGAARAALFSATAGAVAMVLWSRALLGAYPFSARAAVASTLTALLLYAVLVAWTPQGVWVFAYGGVLVVGAWMLLVAARCLSIGRVSNPEPSE